MAFKGQYFITILQFERGVTCFLTMEESEFIFLGDEEWWTKLSFLTDLFEHLNKLNSRMQGSDENILTSSDKIMDFI